MDFEQRIENLYRAVLRPGDRAVDCGAHAGRHTIAMARAVGPTGQVLAFEPLPEAYGRLLGNLASAGLRNVTAVNRALGAEASTVPFVHVLGNPGFSGFRERVYPDPVTAREIVDVEVQRLDDVAEGRAIRFIKVDVEGGDLLVLRGARATIGAARPFVTFELGDNSIARYDYTAADYFDFFAALDYDLFSVAGEPLDRDGLVESSRRQAVWDYVAVPRERGVTPAMLEALRAPAR